MRVNRDQIHIKKLIPVKILCRYHLQNSHFSFIISIFGLNVDFMPIINRTKIIYPQILYQKGSIHNLRRICIIKENSENVLRAYIYILCLIMMLTLTWSFNFHALYTKNEKLHTPSLNVRNVEWFFLYKTSIQRSLYVMAAQNTTTPNIRESGTIRLLRGVGWYGILVICYVEAIIILPGEYLFCMQLRICFSNVLKVLRGNFSAVLFIIAD